MGLTNDGWLLLLPLVDAPAEAEHLVCARLCPVVAEPEEAEVR